MTGIFLCYRAGDDAYAAALLDEKLSHTFGADQVFRASRSIPPGESYSDAIMRAIKECETMLVLIGPNWTRHADDAGVVLLSRPDDWVRTEIATALSSDVRVIPVLLSRTARLNEADLPADVAPLAHRQYLRFEHRTVEDDFSRLVNALAVPGSQRASRG
jgi:hypothetical protein